MGNGEKKKLPDWRRVDAWTDVSILVIVGLGVVIICWVARGRFCLELTIGYVLAALICAAQKVKTIIGDLAEDDPPSGNRVGRVGIKNTSGKFVKRVRVLRKRDPLDPHYDEMVALDIDLPSGESRDIPDVAYEEPICALRVVAELGVDPEQPADETVANEVEPVQGEQGLYAVIVDVLPPIEPRQLDPKCRLEIHVMP